MKKLLSLAIALLTLITLVSCAPTPPVSNGGEDTLAPTENTDYPHSFHFDITIPKFSTANYYLAPSVEWGNLRFTVIITTTYNPSDPEETLTSTNFYGGRPVILMPDGSELAPAARTDGFASTPLSAGDTVEYAWCFSLPTDFEWGEYDIKVTCMRDHVIFENATISPDTCDQIKTAEFDFDISLDNFKLNKTEDLYFSDVDMISFDLTVTTTCTSGRYKYVSSVTPGFDGGIPTILLPDGSEIKHDLVDKAMGSDKVDIKKGDKTVRIWRFTVPTDFAWGEYDIRVETENSVKTFENILVKFKE